MASFNRVILMGNLTRDPELRYTPKGTAIAKIGLAVNRQSSRTESGETKEEVTFVDVDSFGRQAETIAQYMKKGSPILVEGRLRLDQWDDKQTGQKRSRLGVVLENFKFVGPANRGEGGGGGGRAVAPPSAPAAVSDGGVAAEAGIPGPEADGDVSF